MSTRCANVRLMHVHIEAALGLSLKTDIENHHWKKKKVIEYQWELKIFFLDIFNFVVEFY